MPIFAFYPTRADGASPSFDLIELGSEAEALRHGRAVCREHQSCDHVVIWEGDRLIGQVWKPEADARI